MCTLQLSLLNPECIQRNVSTYIHQKNTYENVYNALCKTAKRLETIQMSLNSRIDKVQTIHTSQ